MRSSRGVDAVLAAPLAFAVCCGPVAASDVARVEAFSWPKGARAAVVLTYDDGMDVQLDHAAAPDTQWLAEPQLTEKYRDFLQRATQRVFASIKTETIELK